MAISFCSVFLAEWSLVFYGCLSVELGCCFSSSQFVRLKIGCKSSFVVVCLGTVNHQTNEWSSRKWIPFSCLGVKFVLRCIYIMCSKHPTKSKLQALNLQPKSIHDHRTNDARKIHDDNLALSEEKDRRWLVEEGRPSKRLLRVLKQVSKTWTEICVSTGETVLPKEIPLKTRLYSPQIAKVATYYHVATTYFDHTFLLWCWTWLQRSRSLAHLHWYQICSMNLGQELLQWSTPSIQISPRDWKLPGLLSKLSPPKLWWPHFSIYPMYLLHFRTWRMKTMLLEIQCTNDLMPISNNSHSPRPRKFVKQLIILMH